MALFPTLACPFLTFSVAACAAVPGHAGPPLASEALAGGWTSRPGGAGCGLTLRGDGTGTISVPRGPFGTERYRIERWTLENGTLDAVARGPGGTLYLHGDACPDALLVTITTVGGARYPVGFRRLEDLMGPPVCGGRGPHPPRHVTDAAR